MKIHKFKILKKQEIPDPETIKNDAGKKVLAQMALDGRIVIAECIYCGAWESLKPGNPNILRRMNKQDAYCPASRIIQSWFATVLLFGKYNCLIKN